MKSEIEAAFYSSKRNCFLCHTYRNIRPNDNQKEMAQTATKRGYDLLRVAFDELRAQDAPLQQLEALKAAKILCLDAIDACGSCDRQRPRIKEILIDIK